MRKVKVAERRVSEEGERGMKMKNVLMVVRKVVMNEKGECSE